MANKPWLKNYPKDVPEFIAPLNFNSIPDLFRQTVERFPFHPAFTNFESTFNFSEIDELSLNFASYLLSLGLNKGDRIAIMLPNCLQYPIALLGILRAGLIVVNVNPLYTARELKHQLIDSGAKTIIILENFAHVLASVQTETPVQKIIVSRLSDMLPFYKGFLMQFILKYIKKAIPAYQIKEPIEFKKTLKSRLAIELPVLNLEDIAFLQYTGGTTGVSKGTVLTHGNILSNISQIKTWISSGKNIFEGQEIVITALPLYHIFSLTANLLLFLSLGAENVLITNPHDMKAFIGVLKHKKFSCISGVNTLYEGLMNARGFAELDFSRLKLAIAGGMATKSSTASRWKQITHTVLLESYGLTEASPGVSVNPIDTSEFSGSIGLPLPSTDCEIRNEAGIALPHGEIGELCIKGPQVMQGYWQKNTADLSEDGWLKTGDIAYMDEGGYIYIKDRKKDMILVSGFNVYPTEIEAIVSSHPDVVECAAIGVADDKTGEAIALYVVSRNPNLDKASIIEHCRKNLTAYKIPKHILFRDKLPKSTIGKVLRRALLEMGT